METSKDILVIGPSWIGDMVMAQALFKALRHGSPDACIDVTAPEWALGVLSRMPEVRAAIALPFQHGEARLADRWRFGRSLHGKYGLAYVLPGSWKSALVPFAAGISERVGYLKEQRWLLLNRIIGLPKLKKNKTMTTYQALVDKAVFNDPTRLYTPSLDIDIENQTALLARNNLQRGQFALLVPGAEFGSAKRWPARHFAALANDFINNGMKVVLVGSKKDVDASHQISSLVADAIDLTGLTSITDVIDLAEAARCVVANDSGLLHVAAAVGVPVVGVYGSTSALDTPPHSDRACTVSLNLPCSPCGKRECPLGHHDCLEKLEPKIVRQALERLEKQVA